MFSNALIVSALLAVNCISVEAAPKTSGTINWFSCPQNETAIAPYECGTLQVPLDYTSSDAGTLELKMVRVNHTKEPFLGSILFNAGGPGLATRSLVAEGGASFLELTGGQFDLIGHDPRGTGDTIPYTCFNQSETARSGLTVPGTTDASDVAPGQIFTDKYLLAQACARESAEYAELVGTAFTARDLMQIVDALGEDGLLRFWGFSYGSALGTTVAAMFPDRMDRIVIDAVLNMRQYYAGIDTEQVFKTDAAFRHFLEACMEGRDQCVLSKQASSATELEAKIYDLLSMIKKQPLALGPSINDVVNYHALKVMINPGLRTPPITWPILAQMLDALFERNITAYNEAFSFFSGYITSESWPDLGANYGGPGIRCSDHSFRTDNLDDLYPINADFEETSYIGGGFIAAAQPMTCAQWPFKAKEQLQWTPGYETRHPLLIVGNTFDPLTPVESAFNTSADFPGSRVLHQNTGGHGSISHASICTANTIRSYFVNGTLPEEGLVCEPDDPLAGFSSPESAMKKRSLMAESDVKLLDAIQKVQENTHSHFMM